jgi:Trk-type K+ transport system membrane component
VILELIVLEGIGFPVLLEIGQRLPALLPWRKRPCVAFFSLHTRLVLIMTGLFILGGALLLLGGSGGTGSYWEALFNSITARTAGFNIRARKRTSRNFPSSQNELQLKVYFLSHEPKLSGCEAIP